MTKQYKIYDNVAIGQNAQIEEFTLIGKPTTNKNMPTKIGKNATIRSHTIIYAGNTIGEKFQTGHHTLIRENNEIGNNVSIGSFTDIEHHIKIGDNVRIHSNCFIPEYTTIKKDAWIGPGSTFTNALHPRCPKVKNCLKGPTIEEKAIVGANVTILPHVTIGKNAFIGAGSIVIDNVPSDTVVCGTPAKQIKKISDFKCRFNYIKKPYETKEQTI